MSPRFGRSRVLGPVGSSQGSNLGQLVRPRRRQILSAGGPPPTISTAIAEWWAGNLNLTDGNLVDSWLDRIAGASLDGTTVTRPTFKAGDLNNRPTLSFDSSDYLHYTGELTTVTQGCVVVVGQFTSVAAQQMVWASQDEAGVNRYLNGNIDNISSGQVSVQQLNADSVDWRRSADPPPLSQPTILEWASTGSAYSVRIDNTVQTLAGSGSDTGDWFGDTADRDNFTVGGYFNSGGAAGRVAANTLISYVGVFSEPLSDPDRSALYQWAAAEYGITVA